MPPALTPRNSYRNVLNFEAAYAAATESCARMMVSVARDTCKKHHLSREDQLALLSLDDDQTGGAPGYLPLVQGMTYMLKSNTGTEIGLVNGAQMVLCGVVLNPKEPDFDRAPGLAPRFLRYLPEILFFQVENPTFLPFPGLPPGVVPIQIERATSFTRHTDLRSKAMTNLPHVRISRKQFKLVLAHATTGYNAQGKSLERAAVVMDAKSKAVDVYVLLSRLTSLAGLTLLQWFPLSLLQQRRQPQMLAEMQRLRDLADELEEKSGAPAYTPLTGDPGDSRCGCAWCRTNADQKWRAPPPAKSKSKKRKRK